MKSSGNREKSIEIWSKEKDNLYRLYVEKKLSTKQIGEIYDCYNTTILRWLKYFNIPLRGNRTYAKYNVDIHFFDNIDTEEKAYILGYIFSDGHVAKNNNIMFGCDMNDEDVLIKIKRAMKSEHPIRNKFSSYGHPISTLMITCKELHDRLLELGFNNRKSYGMDFNRLLSNIPRSLLNHFTRGIFDGDGSIRVYKYNYLKKHQYHFGYTGIIDSVKFFDSMFNIGCKYYDETGKGLTYTIRSANKHTIYAAYHILYNDANIYMDRKKKTFDEFIKISVKENGIYYEPSTTIISASKL